jgi:hypothetical protein
MATFSASTQALTNAIGVCGFRCMVAVCLGADVVLGLLTEGLGFAEGSPLQADPVTKIAAASTIEGASRSNRTLTPPAIRDATPESIEIP